MKRLLYFVLVAALLLPVCLSSCGLSSGVLGDPKVFTQNDMQITLTEQFESTTYPNYTVVYDSSEVDVFVLKEGFSLLEGLGDYTLKQYADLIKKNNPQVSSDSALQTDGGVTWFEYTAVDQYGVLFHYYVYVYKTGDAFWMIQFIVKDSLNTVYSDAIGTWAKSVTFTQ